MKLYSTFLADCSMRVWLLIAAATLLVIAFFIHSPQPPVENVLLAASHGENIILFTGKGKIEREIISSEEVRYKHPSLNSSGDILLVREEYKPIFRQNIVLGRSENNIVRMRIGPDILTRWDKSSESLVLINETLQENLIVGTITIHGIVSSRDTQNIAFIEGIKTKILLRATGEIIEIPSEYYDTFAWLDNDHLVLFLPSIAKDQNDKIFLFSIRTGTLNEVCQGMIEEKFHNGVLLKNEKIADMDCITTPEAGMLFGDSRWPVRHIISSSDKSGRYYFYRRWRECLFLGLINCSSEWIEGYDRETKQTFHVYTLKHWWENFL